MGRITLVLGGARSGKSRFAQELALRLRQGQDSQSDLLYIATSEAGDAEMRQRIEKHREDRPPDFKTIEAPLSVSEAIAREDRPGRVVLVDCITLLVSNILLKELGGKEERLPEAERSIEREIGRIIETVREISAELIIVSNELGLGVVPPTFLGRVFRDLAGFANQRLAAEADEVFFIVAGLARKIK